MAKIIESQIISGLYGIFDMNGSIFFIKSKKSKLIMIDSGLFYQKNNIKKFLNKYNFSFNDITNILITHGEGDHVGTIPYIKKKNPKVIIHGSSLTDNYMKKRINPPHWFFPVNIFLQTVFLFTFKKTRITKIINDNQLLNLDSGIKVIYTPGHTDDHVSYWWVDKKVLFSGDLFFVKKNILKIFPKFITKDFIELKKSVKRVISLNPKIICSGHSDNFYNYSG